MRDELRQPDGDNAQHSILGQDVFSLIVARSKARGLAVFSGDEPSSIRWGHNDAGGQTLPELIRARSMDRDDVQQTEVPAVEPPYGTSWLLDPGERFQLAWQCSLPTWSIDAAGWLAELLVETLRELAVTAPVAISVTGYPVIPPLGT
ncbi:MAG TPA: hypothetical protein VH298_10735 [Jatrophihabitans sp.]|nr:hypothetical protein [Jatrophihabitans sp.]